MEKLTKAKKELYCWQYGNFSTSFSSLLFILFQKADPNNTNRLSTAFPEYKEALDLWHGSEDPEKLLKEWNKL